jgi:hypothetical protein
VEWSKKFTFGRSSVLGNFLEPAMTSANTVMQTILGAPFAWRWNRVITGFVTTAGQQDYTLFSYKASTNVKAGWLTVDDAGNSQKCTTAGATGSSAPTWNHTLNSTTTDGTVTWTNLGPINGTTASNVYSFGWIETSSVQDSNNKWYEMTSRLSLGLDSQQGRPGFIAAQGDDGQGNITFRLMPAPSAAYPVVLTLQQKPPLFTGVSQTWTPIPDEYSHIYNWGFLSLMWLFSDDPRFGLANQKFVAQLLGASEGLSETQVNIFLGQWQAITGQPISNQDRMQQGYQSRGM